MVTSYSTSEQKQSQPSFALPLQTTNSSSSVPMARPVTPQNINSYSQENMARPVTPQNINSYSQENMARPVTPQNVTPSSSGFNAPGQEQPQRQSGGFGVPGQEQPQQQSGGFSAPGQESQGSGFSAPGRQSSGQEQPQQQSGGFSAPGQEPQGSGFSAPGRQSSGQEQPQQQSGGFSAPGQGQPQQQSGGFSAPKQEQPQTTSGFSAPGQQSGGSNAPPGQNLGFGSVVGTAVLANKAFDRQKTGGIKPGQQNTGFTEPGQQSSGFTAPGQQSSGFTAPGQQSSGFTAPGQQSGGFSQPGQQSGGSSAPLGQNPGFGSVVGTAVLANKAFGRQKTGGFNAPGQQSSGFTAPGQQSGGFSKPGQQSGGFSAPPGQNPGFGSVVGTAVLANKAFGRQKTGGFNAPGQQSSGFTAPGQQSGGFSKPGQQSGGFTAPGQQSGGFTAPGQQSGGFTAPGQQSGGFTAPGQQSGGFSKPGQQSGGFTAPGQQSGGFSRPGQQSGGFTAPGQQLSTSFGSQKQKPVWTRAVTQDGREYYKNHLTQKTQWEKPLDFVDPISQSPWIEKTDPKSGRKYYVNTQTKSTQWQKPQGFKGSTEKKETPKKVKTGEYLFALKSRGGVLSWTDFQPLLRAIGWDDKTALNLWYQTDLDRSGTLDKNEFMTFANRRDTQQFVKKLEDKEIQTAVGRKLFHEKSTNGVLNYKDFLPLCKLIGWNDMQVMQLWYQVDKDRSNTLDEIEWLTLVSRPKITPFIKKMEQQLHMPGSALFKHMQQQGKIVNNAISWQVFMELLSQIGWSPSVAQTLWYQTDTDRSGTLDYGEFLTFAGRPDCRPYVSKLEQSLCGPASRLFDYIDGRGGSRDGRVSWNEFAQLAGQVGMSSQQAMGYWLKTDTDQSGYLDKREFATFSSYPDVKRMIDHLIQSLRL